MLFKTHTKQDEGWVNVSVPQLSNAQTNLTIGDKCSSCCCLKSDKTHQQAYGNIGVSVINPDSEWRQLVCM